MATHTTVQWENLQQYNLSLVLPSFQSSNIKDVLIETKNTSFLYSKKLKANLLESKKAFLNLSADEPPEMPPKPQKPKTSPTKKVSFKVKKTPSIYRRTPNNKVTELTHKFNGLINEKTIYEHPTKAVKRANSQKSVEKSERKMNAVTRKPSVKTKPVLNDKDLLVIRRRAVNRKPVLDSATRPIRARIGYLEAPQTPQTEEIAPAPPPKRPNTLAICPERPPKPPKLVSPTSGTVRAAIEIFERRSSPVLTAPKPAKPEAKRDQPDFEIVQISSALPQRRCDSMYETGLRKTTITNSKSVETIGAIKPNASFLWSINQHRSPTRDDWKSLYDFVEPQPELPPKNGASNAAPSLPPKNRVRADEEKLYEELKGDGYEYCDTGQADDYEYCASPLQEQKENIYETLPVRAPSLPRRQQQQPLPPRPSSRSSFYGGQGAESNCYESIYSKTETESNYESIYGDGVGSVISSDQKSNSLYGRASFESWSDDGTTHYGKATSDLSSSDRSDNWVDITDNEDNEPSFETIVVREKHRMKKSNWVKLQQNRDQSAKIKQIIPMQESNKDSDNHYEPLSHIARPPEDDYDSFDSDLDDSSFDKVKLNDSVVDIANAQLPEPPNHQIYGLTRIAAEKLRKFHRTLTLPKNITKSLSRIGKRKSKTDLPVEPPPETHQAVEQQPVPPSPKSDQSAEYAETKSLGRKGLLHKFRRSMSLSGDLASEVTSNLENKPKSTFYLTNEIDIDSKPDDPTSIRDSTTSLVSQKKITRPQSPPPPIPKKRMTSWYAEVGLFKTGEIVTEKSSTCWYAEVGLYPANGSTPSSSSAENSGTNTNSIKTEDFINHDNSDEYYNMKNETTYYSGHSINSLSSGETKVEKSLTPDIQLRLQNEPLYQFYDEAILDTVCSDGTAEYDSDGYEDVGKSVRPTAMEIVAPSRNSLAFNRTLWCEIPEVIHSAVLSTLSAHQQKLQEAKFEMVTSEASYLNSLNVLNDHFIANIGNFDLTSNEMDILFGKVAAVRKCSEMLLYDLERCWQDNILLNGVCDIVQKHAEENFHVYIDYCENQILLDDTLKRIKEKNGFLEFLKQLEASTDCQSLTLYSFLLLPMQRITRWPLLVDAVLKRLSNQDSEYLTCQYTLATINKIVNQCNEGARRMERENEMRKLVHQLEFPKGVPPIELVTENRWLVRSGTVTHMQQRTDELKLTFGKRFSKTTLNLFLFTDLLFITKMKNENLYTVMHYCRRNLVELNSTEALASLPTKDSQGRHLIFLTLLENHNQKTVEFLLSCSSESNKERWMEALTPPVSENPNETIYGCWDCPQVTAVHSYPSGQPDELALARGDIINVLRKTADGWYHGERIRDGQTGWFPANYTAEIANQHVRSRNLRQRYRLLTFSENYLKTK